MDPAIAHPPVGPAPSFPSAPRELPTLEQLYEMTSVPEHRIVISDVDWAFYEQLVDSIPPGVNIHADYDGKDIEIVALGGFHDGIKKNLGRFVELVTEELDIPCRGLGQTTWRRPEIARGLESDECYFFDPAKLDAIAAASQRQSENIADYPNPDLAIEVDISASKIDRPGIYAALRVAEVWRYDGRRQGTVIDRLTPAEIYEAGTASGFLPVHVDEVARWAIQEDARNGSLWARRLRAWVQAELVPRLAR